MPRYTAVDRKRSNPVCQEPSYSSSMRSCQLDTRISVTFLSPWHYNIEIKDGRPIVCLRVDHPLAGNCQRSSPTASLMPHIEHQEPSAVSDDQDPVRELQREILEIAEILLRDNAPGTSLDEVWEEALRLHR